MELQESVVGRRSVRALLLDDDSRLILIKRTKPGQRPYWTAPGGGVEESDGSALAALERELAEELGAVAAISSRVLVISSGSGVGAAVEEIFAARLVSVDEAGRSGEEWSDPSRGGYEVVRVPLAQVRSINLKPDLLKKYLAENADVLATTVFGPAR